MTFPASLTESLMEADHMDALSVESDTELHPFISRMLAYHPWWLDALYRVRVGFLRVLGHRTGLPPQASEPQQPLPTQSGEKAAFFTVQNAGPHHWMAGASENHLSATLAVLQTPGKHRRYQYRVVTVVKYHNLTGRIYFAVIQPFHFFVVRAMMHSGAKG